MDINTIMWLWIIAGGVFVASELFLPGLIAAFLGLSAFIVALGYKLGFLEGILPGFTTWFITSLFCVFVVREFAVKLLPGDSKYNEINEDVDAFGTVVDVVEDISVKHDHGRIRFRGTTWSATSSAEIIPAGKQAKIVARVNLVWIVEPYEPSLLDEILVDPEG